MKCHNCGADLDRNAKFCPNCGNSTGLNKQVKSNMGNGSKNNNFDVDNILNIFSKNPKLILAAIVFIIAIFAISSIFSSGGESQYTTVYGLDFHIPDGYVEGDRSDLTNGEVLNLKDDGGSTIEISVRANEHFKESKYVDSKFAKTINDKQVTAYVYKPAKNVAFVYYDQGNLVVIRGATFSEVEEIIV